MTSVRIATGHLVGLLLDLLQTAASPEVAAATAGVVLHTTRGHLGDEPGRTTLLVGTSTTGVIVGHTYTYCTGELPPMLWPVAEAEAVVAVLKPMARNAEHAVELVRDGEAVIVREDADLFGDRWSMRFALGDLAEYPASVWELLTAVRLRPPDGPDGPAPAAAARTDISHHDFAPFLAVARRRKSIPSLFRYHQFLPVLVQIGPEYIGLLRPQRWEGGPAAGAAPDAGVYAPDLAQFDRAAIP